MSDLISRSELLKEIEKYKFGAISNDTEREYIKKTILDFINFQPTAYSVDKVVAELKKELSLADKEKERCTGENNLQFDSAKGYASGISTAIEIVKKGGASDDVCEWSKEEDGYRNCRYSFDEIDSVDFFRYCPYCGKKIKVVE